jgi:hypothetical protein
VTVNWDNLAVAALVSVASIGFARGRLSRIAERIYAGLEPPPPVKAANLIIDHLIEVHRNATRKQ